MIRHVIWTYRPPWADAPETGRAGVRRSSERLEIIQLAGRAMPAALLLPTLQQVLGQEALLEAEAAHRARRHPWRVELREGMSGARDYRVRVLRDATWRDTPVSSRIHVSMGSKLNEGVNVWWYDLTPLLARIVRDYPAPAPETFWLHVISPEDPGDFGSPGEPSGLSEHADTAGRRE